MQLSEENVMLINEGGKMKKFFYLVVFLAFFLISCGTDTPPPNPNCPDTPRTLDEFFCKVRSYGGNDTPLREDPPPIDDPTNCPVNSFTLPQDGKIKGSTGGFADSGGLTSNSLISQLGELVDSDYANDSAILIVDDFQFNSDQSPPTIDWFLGANSSIREVIDKLDAAEGIASGSGSASEREQELYNINVTHGSIVSFHTLNLLLQPQLNLGIRDISRVSPSTVIVELFDSSTEEVSASIFVALVDTDGFDTNRIASAIRSSIGTIQSSTNDSVPVAINMSFVLLPCALVEALENAQEQGAYGEESIDTIEEYAAAYIKLGNVSNNAAEELKQDLLAIMFNASNDINDPLRRALIDFNVEQFAFIASAGNFAYKFPFYPGAWQGFISVSAIPGYSGSNYGEISAGGDVLLLAGTNSAGNPVRISAEGTSYAAPLVSVFAAVDMTRSAPRCTYSDYDYINQTWSIRPPDLAHWNVETNPDSPSRYPVNFSLRDAVLTICNLPQ